MTVVSVLSLGSLDQTEPVLVHLSQCPRGRSTRWIFILLGLSVSLWQPLVASAQTSSGPGVYAELHAGVTGVRHSDINFYPGSASFTAGVYVHRGIGLELHVDQGIADGTRANFAMSVSQGVGAGVRFQSPPLDGLTGYIVLGVVNFELEQQRRVADGARLTEDFTASRVSIGLMQRLRSVPNLQVSAEYRNQYSDSGIVVDGLLFGLRFNIR